MMTERARPIATLAAAALFGLSAAAAASVVTVRVTDARGAPVGGASVFACHVAERGPDAESRLAVTDASGAAAFSLTDGLRYEILAAAQGYAPVPRAQYLDRRHPFVVPGDAPASAAVILNPAAAAGEVDALVMDAVPGGVVLAEIRRPGSDLPVGDGLAVADASGFARVQVFNVPFAPAGALVLTAYDPGAGKAAAVSVDRPLNAAESVLTYSLSLKTPPAAAGGRPIKGWAYGGRAIKLAHAAGEAFSVGAKTVSLWKAADAGKTALNTTGTALLLSLPPDMGGDGSFNIFSRAGTPVRALDLGVLEGGFDYYVEWDGKDGKGAPAALGAYYGVFSLPGVGQNATIRFLVTAPRGR